MSYTILTPDELFELTEYRRKDQQRKELSRMGIRFQVSRSGKPQVLRAELYKHFGYAESKANAEPDMHALREITG